MKKIGIEAFNIKPNNTGIGYYIKSLIDSLIDIDEETEYKIYASKLVKNQLLEHNYRLYNVENKLKEAMYKHYFMANISKKDKLDIYHGTSFYIPKHIKCRTVLTVHDLSYIKYPNTFTKSRLIYGKIFIKDSVKRADKIIAVSESTKRDIINYYGIQEEKIFVTHLGARDIFKPATINEIELIKKKYNLNKYILAVGTIEPRKNLLRLIKAFNNVSSKIDEEIKLVLVGKSGWKNEDIFKEIDKNSQRIIFTDYITDQELKCLYSGCELFVYPSLYEGFGLPVLEAMSCGSKVVTSNISSLPEITGNIATLINPSDIDEISEGILKELNNLRDKKEILKQANLFSWNKAARETKSLYDLILS